MISAEDLKLNVKKKYAEIAVSDSQSGCCCGCGDSEMFNIMKDDYENVAGYQDVADLGLGCGIPTQYANLQPGQTVLDLGSGAGNDAFIASKEVGSNGKVIGIDMTEQMIAKANENKAKLAIDNVEFVLGEIEAMPLADESIDVIVSNCVLNLVPDKTKAFSEMYRTLISGGHFCVSDIVIQGNMPEAVKNEATLYAGCVSGAVLIDEYLGIISKTGFKNQIIHKKKKIDLPEDMLAKLLSPEEIKEYHESDLGIFSITVSATK